MTTKLPPELLLKNLRSMKGMTDLLKFGASGKPKFRKFCLNQDSTAIEWKSNKKSLAETRILISNIKEIRYGQRTPKFARHNRRDLEHLSFSIIYDNGSGGASGGTKKKGVFEVEGESLDLVCRDEAQFQVWASTMMALVKKEVTQEMLDQVNSLMPAVTRDESLQHEHRASIGGHGGFQDSNDVYTFGWGEWGQTATPEIQVMPTPKLSKSMLGRGVIQIACGWSHTTILLESGGVQQCGNRLSTGLDDDYSTPAATAISPRIGVITIACGAFHSAALTEKGEVLTWGCNFNGQLGHGNTIDIKVPTIVKSIGFIEKIACGDKATAALASDGTLYTWGCGEHGFLGHNSTQDEHSPRAVAELKGAGLVKIAAGGGFMVASTQRETYSWGYNGAGQLGQGHEDTRLRPHVVEGLRGSRVLDIACGQAHVLAIVVVPKIGAQALFVWGSNACSQLGLTTGAKVSKPTSVTLAGSVQAYPVAVSCGDMHSAVRDSKGGIFMCGKNAYGQLGLGTMADVREFTALQVFGDKEVRAVVCGGQHTCVLTARKWVEDSEVKDCMKCRTAFNTFTRRHHCRNCFGIFCNNCSSKKHAILKSGSTDPQRVCDKCFTILRGR